MGSPDPELPQTTLFLTVFFRNFQADISAVQEFVTVGEAGFSALRVTVNLLHSPTLPLPVTDKHRVVKFQETCQNKG